ncbi:hypothetical protein ACFQ4Z_16410 [Oceanobacillus oncorhynchi subsp. oncorhynchi]|uniref:hypothetical protein n=1 Tax=Oceanobacillus TaxID=182709 RepID=UPI0030DD3C93
MKEFETKLMETAEQDKKRYQHHQQNRQEQEQQQIQSKQILPKDYGNMENLSLKDLARLSREV